MSQFTDPLSHVRVAAPCRADWERMCGNERVRFCDECGMNVYNLSNMSKRDAEALILNAEERLCVSYYQRADGTILTANCPVGLSALKRRVSGVSRAVVSSILSFIAGMAVLAGLEKAQNSLGAATDAGLDLISPVPLPAAEEPPREMLTPEPVRVLGGMARIPRAERINGRAEAGEAEMPSDFPAHPPANE